jgi:hypothetical protein
MSTVAVKATKSGANAIHGQDGSDHLVGIGNLRVIICQEDDQWFAQGLEIDYAADGNSFEEVKLNFQNGLRGTIDLHLRAYNSLDKLLKIAPAEAWQELLHDGQRMRYTQVSLHSIFENEKMPFEFPFTNIDYMERQAA